jgi:hypothetical protein
VAASRLLAIINASPAKVKQKLIDSPQERSMHLNPLLQRIARKIRNLRVVRKAKGFLSPPPDNPDDPYALVGAPVRPKLPTLSARAEAIPERYDFN